MDPIISLPLYKTLMKTHACQAKIGHPGALEEALQKLRGKETDISEEAEEIKVFDYSVLES
jgi:hypothetical protein